LNPIQELIQGLNKSKSTNDGPYLERSDCKMSNGEFSKVYKRDKSSNIFSSDSTSQIPKYMYFYPLQRYSTGIASDRLGDGPDEE